MVISCGYRWAVLFISPSILRPSRAPLVRNHVSQTTCVECFTLCVSFWRWWRELMVVGESVQQFFNMRDEELKSVDVDFFLAYSTCERGRKLSSDTLNWEGGWGVGTLARMRILDITLGDIFQLSFCCHTKQQLSHPINPFATQLTIILWVHVVEFF